MKIIVCGAGQVGVNIARQLALENHDVTIVDQAPDLVRRVSDTLDAQAVVGHASHPDVLERAGIADADMLIAVTFADEVNMTDTGVGEVFTGFTGTNLRTGSGNPYVEVEIYRLSSSVGQSRQRVKVTADWTEDAVLEGDTEVTVSKSSEKTILFQVEVT